MINTSLLNDATSDFTTVQKHLQVFSCSQQKGPVWPGSYAGMYLA